MADAPGVKRPPDLPRHPAKFSPAILDRIAEVLRKYNVEGPVLDPFAGTGRVFYLADNPRLQIDALEIEPEWAAYHPRTRVGNVLDLHAAGITAGSLAAVVFSPCYGNRLSDHHEAADPSVRHTYRHTLGHMPSPGSAAVLFWGDGYRKFHRVAYEGLYRALRPGGLAVVNISNFIKRGKVQHVSEWTRQCWVNLGMELLETIDVDTRRLRHGANRAARVDSEQIHVLRKGGGDQQLELPVWR